MSYPSFSVGEVLTAADMNAVGLWKITSGTSSGTTAYNYDGVFTSSYRNYRIVLSNIEVSTAARAVRLQFRASGSTNANAGYDYAFNGLRANGVSANTNNAGGTFTEIGVYIDTYADTQLGQSVIDVINPQISTQRTSGLLIAQGYEGAYYYRSGGFVQGEATAFDGFRILLSGSGNVAYNYAIYGYKN